ncbi:hypothetical protein HGB07_08925 [Candidatus Roizmanbacteria bacterium]|nr:hypothetical protein [Candidatus Roizmanbacteria bacterium]
MQKKIRYIYWIVIAFSKKNARLIILSFLLSIISIISLISLSPFLINNLSNRKQVVGMVGSYEVNDLPESILSKISNGLIYIDDKGDIMPAISNSWEVLNDGKEYRFHIRDNLFWNDGKKFTTADISYGFKDIIVSKIDSHLIVFKLKKPLPIFPTYLTKPIVKYPLDGVAGLYRVERSKITSGKINEIYLTPNKKDLPVLIYKFYDNETKMINAYKLGEINEMTISKKSVADIFGKWNNTKVEQSIDYSQLMTMFFNMNNQLLKQKDIRQAIVQAINESRYDRSGQKATSPIPPISWAYNPNLKIITYNPELSEKILKKSGEGTQAATLNINTFYDYIDIAEAIRDDLAKVGVQSKVNIQSFSQSNQFDILLAFWKVPVDPDQYYFWHSSQTQGNITGYNNVKVDLLLERGRDTVVVEDRKKIYFDFQKIMLDDMPAHFLYFPYIYTIKRK